MIKFPESCEYGRIIAKDKFATLGVISGKLRTEFNVGVERVIASHKLAATTLNIAAGRDFPEIMVLRVILKQQDFNIKILDAMDKSIRAAFVLFVIEYDGKERVSIAFKDKNGDNITLAKRWTTDWLDNVKLNLSGRTIDAVYENLIAQVSNGAVADTASAIDKTLKEKVENAINTDKIKKQIERLRAKMRVEPQFKKQLEIKAQIKKLKERL